MGGKDLKKNPCQICGNLSNKGLHYNKILHHHLGLQKSRRWKEIKQKEHPIMFITDFGRITIRQSKNTCLGPFHLRFLICMTQHFCGGYNMGFLYFMKKSNLKKNLNLWIV
uniref:Uncharacterized protein n=1 Tax=Acrobeloides nanus TaxID=290746 RepID=A0A914E0V9_9BILA